MREPESSKTTWEYKVFKLGPSSANLEEKVLNEYGDSGWELISFQPNGERAYPGEGTYVLKRAK